MPALGLLKPVRCASADDESAVDSASMAIEDAESERARFITTSCLLRSAPSRRSQIFETRNTSLSSRSGRSLHGTRKPVLTKDRRRMVRNGHYARAVVALRGREERSTGAHIEHEIARDVVLLVNEIGANTSVNRNEARPRRTCKSDCNGVW